MSTVALKQSNELLKAWTNLILLNSFWFQWVGSIIPGIYTRYRVGLFYWYYPTLSIHTLYKYKLQYSRVNQLQYIQQSKPTTIYTAEQTNYNIYSRANQLQYIQQSKLTTIYIQQSKPNTIYTAEQTIYNIYSRVNYLQYIYTAE